MRKEDKVALNGVSVTVKELTVAECSINEQLERLEKNCLLLIERCHVLIWDYPWRLYLCACSKKY